MSQLRRVALIYDTTSCFDLKVVEGIATYAHRAANWSLHVEEVATRKRWLSGFHNWNVDGVIANSDNPAIASALAESKCPVVAFGTANAPLETAANTPYFTTNNETIGRLAGEHLLEHGFRRFAFVGHPSASICPWSQQRLAGFLGCADRAGCPCAVYSSRPTNRRNREAAHQALRSWLTSLGTPVGLMACNDRLAQQVLEAARFAGIPVPEEMAVVGVDNDDLLCRLATPPLSSVKNGCAEIGYQAADLLDKVICGQRPLARTFVVEPEGVVTRRSTEILALNDTEVATVLSFIRYNACNGIKVAHVVEASGLSRSVLETRFLSAMGHTIHAEICRVQTQQVKQLLADTALPLKQVARTTGFRSVQYMATVFRRQTGRTPSEYRQRSQATRCGRPEVPEVSIQQLQNLKQVSQ